MVAISKAQVWFLDYLNLLEIGLDLRTYPQINGGKCLIAVELKDGERQVDVIIVKK